jgi:hypothetical protein
MIKNSEWPMTVKVKQHPGITVKIYRTNDANQGD